MINEIVAALHNNYGHVNEKTATEILELLPLDMVLSASKADLVLFVQNVQDSNDKLFRKYNR